MKANRCARTDPTRRLCRDERGASEVVGYMIAFGISSMILVLSLNAFNAMRDYSGDLVADRTVKEMGNRVSFAVDEALQSGSQFPESNYSRTIRIPQEVHDNTYTLELGRQNLWVNLTHAESAIQDENGNDLETHGRVNVTLIPRANTEVLCTGGNMEIPNGTCRAYSMDGEVTIEYGRPDPNWDKGVYMIRP